MELLEYRLPDRVPAPTVFPGVEIDERAARRSLRDQIAKLERELGEVFVDAYPTGGITWSVSSRGGPRVLGLGELERVRDDLAERLGHVRAELTERAEEHAEKRLLVERMLLEPVRYRWVRVTNADIGERGCRSWHVTPRLGLIGMLAGWWHVKISSGCPLAGGPRRAAAPFRPWVGAVASASRPPRRR